MKRTRTALLAAPILVLVVAAFLIGRASDSGEGAAPSNEPDRQAASSASMEQPASEEREQAVRPPSSGTPAAVPAARSAPGPNDVLYTFDDQPDAPRSAYWLEGWDVQVHSRDPGTWQQLDAGHAGHGPGCEAPPATHEFSHYEDAVYLCRDHIMTSLNSEGYGAIYLTPPEMVDFSAGEAVIRFDVSTLQTAPARDWWDVWITPFEENLTIPLEHDTPDGQGPPNEAIQVRLTDNNALCVHDYRDADNVEPGPFDDGNTCQHWDGYDRFLEPSAAIRSTFEVRVTQTSVKVSLLDANGGTVFTWHDYRPATPFSFTKAVVQFGHHSYNPEKDGGGGNTWHWDNVRIAPAAPMTIIRATQRFVRDGESVAFPTPAPADARLRFSGIGAIQVSFDGGESWEEARRQEPLGPDATHFSAYWTPIPEGATTVAFKFDADGNYFDKSFEARDITIWAMP